VTRPQRSRWHGLAGAVMLGVGAIFQARPEDHWSRAPKVTVEAGAEAGAAGDPPT